LLLALVLPPAAHAEWDVDGLEELLPRGETAAERAYREQFLRSPDRATVLADPPPAAPVRNCAEWEPTVGVLVRYPLGLPYSLLRDFDDVTTIYVVVASGTFATAQANFVANAVDTTRVEWLVRPNNSIWTRDYGPWFVFDGNGDVAIVDHVYNRPARPADDLIPVEFGNAYGYPVIRHDMWHTGGNYRTDGAHLSMSTDLVYDEALSANGLTPSQVDALMNTYYGVDAYSVIDDISPSGIHHIDTWGKMLDEETILMKETVPAHSTYAALEQRATLIASLPSSTGRNYQVVRVFCHLISGGNPASYTNSLILNDRVYVPLFNHAANDAAALDVYRAAMPGYEVLGYTYGSWLTDDALHCRAKGIMDPQMLRVGHVPIVDPQNGPVDVVAFVDDRSEAGLTAVELHYRLDGGSWVTEPMSAIGGDEYSATIPHPGVSSLADYYVRATDATGREEGMPRSEPAGWYSFEFLGATDAPLIASAVDVHPGRPNPFRGRTTFEFELKYEDRVDLAVYDVRGRIVRTLVSGVQRAGTHGVAWDPNWR
jgi:agmatine/peptidylarginine deiminase